MKTLVNRSGIFAFVIVCLCALMLAGCSASATQKGQTTQQASDASGQTYRPKKFRLGLFGSDEAAERIKKFSPLCEYLKQQLGMEVELFIGSDYVTVVEALAAKKVDAMYVGPFSYVLAAQEANAEAITAGVDAEGKTYYHSLILTRSSGEIKSMDDLKARSKQLTFAFVDPASTSGHLFPRVMLSKAGIDPDKDFKQTIFAGSHPASLLAILNGKVDAGANSSGNYKKMIDQGVAKAEDFRILATSDPIPNTPLAVRRDLDLNLKAKFRQAILDAPPELLKNSFGSVQRPVTDKDYDVIRETARILKLDLRSMH